MRFRILGPLEACDKAGAELLLGGAKQRALLAILLLDANRVVSTDRLIDELWGERPPKTAAAAVQNYVSHLRKLLESDHAPGSAYELLVTQPPGYVLRLEPEELDLHRFQRLLGSGRQALADGRPRAASGALHEALALWRGPALADFAFEPFAQDEIAALEELRLAALEERIEADLALGRHADLAGELQVLVAEHPVHERLRGQLMLALYRSGRQSEALEAYQEARRALVEELGIDPSPALRELHRAILNQDASLDFQAPTAAPRTNLPVPDNPLIGRERELAEVSELLRREDVRLLTLTGAPGTGKSRLALEVAATLLDELEDGVFLVRLAPVTDPELVPSTIAQTLGVSEQGGESIVETLKSSLGPKAVLLLLDNFEQVLAAAPLLSALLAGAPGLKLLVTSRAGLHLRGEHEYHVLPLALPDPERLPGAATLARYAAVELFVQRAQAVTAGFEPAEANARAVAEICVRLDGLPLAIELAAARSSLLPPQAMLKRLERRLQLLTGGARDLPERQRTLRAALDWSYGLLDESERRLFARLAVFVGGRTLEAAEAVCDRDLELDVLEGLASLVAQSLLVQRAGADGEPRFLMLQTVREYASELLEESGEAYELGRRHAEYFLELAERAEPQLTGPTQVEWFERLEAEHDNIRAALTWSREAGATELELRLAGAIARFWYVRGHLREGHRLLEGVLARSGEQAPAPRAKALLGIGALAFLQGDYERAVAFWEKSLGLYRDLYDTHRIAHCLSMLGTVAVQLNDHERARPLFEEGRELARAVGDKWALAHVLANLGELALNEGEHERARLLSEESLALHRELGDGRGIAYCLVNLGFALLHQGRNREAADTVRESLQRSRELGDKGAIATCLVGLAAATSAEDADRAAQLLGASEAQREAIGARLFPFEHSAHERTVAAVRAGSGNGRFRVAWAEGRAMTLEQAVDCALEPRAADDQLVASEKGSS